MEHSTPLHSTVNCEKINSVSWLMLEISSIIELNYDVMQTIKKRHTSEKCSVKYIWFQYYLEQKCYAPHVLPDQG